MRKKKSFQIKSIEHELLYPTECVLIFAKTNFIFQNNIVMLNYIFSISNFQHIVHKYRGIKCVGKKKSQYFHHFKSVPLECSEIKFQFSSAYNTTIRIGYCSIFLYFFLTASDMQSFTCSTLYNTYTMHYQHQFYIDIFICQYSWYPSVLLFISDWLSIITFYQNNVKIFCIEHFLMH